MKVIVTGFSPFGNHLVNPSMDAVLDLPANVKFDDNSPDAELVKLILPTCCLDAFQALSVEVERWQAETPFALVLCGLAESYNRIGLERFALNVRDFRIADNQGHQWVEEHIVEGAPDALRSKVRLQKLLRHMDKAGFACDISSHAGTFVCNETYYRSMERWQGHPNCRGILFVHLPSYNGYDAPKYKSTEAGQVKEIYVKAIAEIAAFISASS